MLEMNPALAPSVILEGLNVPVLREPTDGGVGGRTGRLEWSSSHCHSPSLTLLNPLYSPPRGPPPGQGSLNKYLSLKESGQSKLSTFQLSNSAA